MLRRLTLRFSLGSGSKLHGISVTIVSPLFELCVSLDSDLILTNDPLLLQTLNRTMWHRDPPSHQAL